MTANYCLGGRRLSPGADWPAATACFQRALAIAPDSAKARIGLAYLEVFRNSNPAAGRKILREIPPGIDPNGEVTEASWDLAMLERDYNSAEKILTDSPSAEFPRAGGAPKTFYLGRVALARGDIASAQRNFAAAVPGIEEWIRESPNNAFHHARLGLLYAYQGRKEDALREGASRSSSSRREKCVPWSSRGSQSGLDLRPDGRRGSGHPVDRATPCDSRPGPVS